MVNNIMTDQVARDIVLNALVCQRLNDGRINIDDLFQKLEGGRILSKEQIERALDRLETEGRSLQEKKLSPTIHLLLNQQKR